MPVKVGVQCVGSVQAVAGAALLFVDCTRCAVANFVCNISSVTSAHHKVTVRLREVTVRPIYSLLAAATTVADEKFLQGNRF